MCCHSLLAFSVFLVFSFVIFLLFLNKSVIIHLDGLKQNRISILRSSKIAQ